MIVILNLLPLLCIASSDFRASLDMEISSLETLLRAERLLFEEEGTIVSDSGDARVGDFIRSELIRISSKKSKTVENIEDLVFSGMRNLEICTHHRKSLELAWTDYVQQIISSSLKSTKDLHQVSKSFVDLIREVKESRLIH